MYTIDYTAIIAVALVVLVLVFMRISWTLKDIHDALAALGPGNASRPAQAGTPSVASAGKGSSEGKAVAEATDETEIAAVIAVAHAALRDAV